MIGGKCCHVYETESLLSGLQQNYTFTYTCDVYPNIHKLHVHVKIALSNIDSCPRKPLYRIMPAVDHTEQIETAMQFRITYHTL